MRGRLLAVLGTAVLLGACTQSGRASDGTDPDTMGTTTTAPRPAPSAASAPETRAGTATTVALLPTETDLETNVTVFFDPISVTDTAQAESVLAGIVGDAPVDSITIIDRTEAWSAAEALATQSSTSPALDPSLQESVGEVARIVVRDREVRNRLTDDSEDSAQVFGVAYVVGAREGSSRPPLVTPWMVWELLGFFWQPG